MKKNNKSIKTAFLASVIIFIIFGIILFIVNGNFQVLLDTILKWGFAVSGFGILFSGAVWIISHLRRKKK